jgi:Mg2+ and Co2+ transporter CorA
VGDYFRVEVQQLDTLVNQLHQSQDDMRTALNAMRDTGPKTTGSEALDNACEEFHDSWDDAIKKITDGTAQIEDGLCDTRAAYAETEQAIADALVQGTGGGATAGDR